MDIYVLTPDGTNNAESIVLLIEKMLKDHINYESDVQLIKHFLMKTFVQGQHDFQANIVLSQSSHKRTSSDEKKEHLKIIRMSFGEREKVSAHCHPLMLLKPWSIVF